MLSPNMPATPLPQIVIDNNQIRPSNQVYPQHYYQILSVSTWYTPWYNKSTLVLSESQKLETAQSKKKKPTSETETDQTNKLSGYKLSPCLNLDFNSQLNIWSLNMKAYDKNIFNYSWNVSMIKWKGYVHSNIQLVETPKRKHT